MRALDIQGKALALFYSLLPERRQFGAAEANRRIYVFLDRPELCLKCATSYKFEERLWCNKLPPQQQIRRQEAKLRQIETLDYISLTQETDFQCEDEKWYAV